MKETNRIIDLFKKLYRGSPWIDVNIKGSLEKLTAKQAATRVFEKYNTIWEIVNHVISWRLNVLQRVQGKVIKTPAHNYIEKITDTSETAWKNTLKKLDDSQIKWISFLKSFKTEDYSKVYPNNKMNYYEHIHGIIQHDAYHLGQIILLKKYLN